MLGHSRPVDINVQVEFDVPMEKTSYQPKSTVDLVPYRYGETHLSYTNKLPSIPSLVHFPPRYLYRTT
jgi:hypothetical protein